MDASRINARYGNTGYVEIDIILFAKCLSCINWAEVSVELGVR